MMPEICSYNLTNQKPVAVSAAPYLPKHLTDFWGCHKISLRSEYILRRIVSVFRVRQREAHVLSYRYRSRSLDKSVNERGAYTFYITLIYFVRI